MNYPLFYHNATMYLFIKEHTDALFKRITLLEERIATLENSMYYRPKDRI